MSDLPPFSPSSPLWVAQIAGYGDPAFDRDHDGFAAALRLYEQTRRPEHLAAIPLVPGARLTLWKLRPLTPAERTDVKGFATEDLRRFIAFRTAVVARIDGGAVSASGEVTGPERPAPLMPNGKLTSDDWLTEQVADAGGGIVDELGALVLQRATVHPKAPRPYRLPQSLLDVLRGIG